MLNPNDAINRKHFVHPYPMVAMSSKPKFYRLDLVNLGELFDPDVPFSVP